MATKPRWEWLDKRVLVAAIAMLVFSGSLCGGFVLDDTRVVRDNPEITSLRRSLAYFGADYLWPHVVSGYYRPLVHLSYAVDHAVGAGTPLVFHATNLALHALCSLLVLALFLELGASTAVAVGGACLFAAHAVHTEAVANLAGRNEGSGDASIPSSRAGAPPWLPVCQLRGNHAQALRHFDRALEIEPSYRDAYRNAGISLFVLGDLEQAIRVFRDELTRSPDDRELMGYLIRALQRLGRFREADEVLARLPAG